MSRVAGAALDDDALVTVDMGVGGGEAAPLGPHMIGDSFEAQIVEAYQPGLGAHPYFAADTLRLRRVVSLIVNDVTVAMHTVRFASTKQGNRAAGSAWSFVCSAWVKKVPTC